MVPDSSHLPKELKVQLERIERQLQVTVGVKFDTKQARAAAARLRSSLEQISFKDINVSLRPTETLLGTMAVYLHRMHEASQRMMANLRQVSRSVVDITKRAFNLRAHWRGISKAIGTVPKRIRAIRARGLYENFLRTGDAVHRLGKRATSTVRLLARLGAGAVSGVSKAFSGLSNAASNAVSRLGQISRRGWLVVAVFAAAAPAIGLVSSLLAGLPSLAAVAGGAIAAIALGFDGIKQAASQLSPLVDRLKSSLSDTFAQGLGPVFAQLAAVFPVLEKGLTNVANGLVPMAQAFTEVVTSAQGMEQIQSILDNTGRFLRALSPMIRDATSAFLTLADAGSKSFGLLADVLNDFAADFRAMVERVTADGSFERAMQGLAQVTAAFLDMFTRLMEAGIRVMGDLGGPLSTLITGFTDALVSLMPVLGSLSGLLATVLGEALSALAPAFEALAPSIGLLASQLGELLVGAIQALTPVLVPLAQIIGDVLTMALRAIQPILPPLIEFLKQLGQAVGTALVEAFTALTPFLELVAQFLTDVLTALTPLLPPLATLATTILQGLLDILTPLIPPLMQLAELIFPILVKVIEALVPVVESIVEALNEFLPIVFDIVGAIAEAMIPVFESILSVVEKVWPDIQQIIEGAMKVIQGIIDVVMGIISGDWSRAWDGVKKILSGAWKTIKAAVRAGIKLVIGFFTDLPGGILRTLGDLGKLLWDVGVSILEGLLEGLKAAWDKVSGWVSDVGGWIADLKGPLPYDRRLLTPAGKAIMQGLHDGLQDSFATVETTVRGMADRLARAFDGDDIGTRWARSVEDGTPAAVRAVDDLMTAATRTANVEWQGHLESGDFGSIEDRITEALSHWGVEIDPNGLAKLVNKANLRRARRG
ncbi:phage tail protein [Amycolatopsis cihanbeyliensis]|uniref:phage tail protein n=1 Tax=Amycolatopsis cihanbeyliensis TaxID=1128664 RepID=UPI001B86AB62|nr:hypothetical protein [Amycolatopsis cihanbeyliensis]